MSLGTGPAHRWVGDAHEREHDRIADQLRRMSRELAAIKFTPEERRAVEAAAVKMVADDAIDRARRRREPIWRDRRAVLSLSAQALVALVVVLTWLHTVNPGLP